MTIQQVMQALDGRPDLFAVRPSGKIIQLTMKGKILQHGKKGLPHTFCVTRSDLMTDDWRVMTLEQLRAEAEAAMAAAQAQEQT